MGAGRKFFWLQFLIEHFNLCNSNWREKNRRESRDICKKGRREGGNCEIIGFSKKKIVHKQKVVPKKDTTIADL